MNTHRFTQYARDALRHGHWLASRGDQPLVSAEFLLLGLLHHPDSVANRMLAELKVDPAAARAAFAPATLDGVREGTVPAAALREVVELAHKERKSSKAREVDTGHLLIALASEPDSAAGRWLAEQGADADALQTAHTCIPRGLRAEQVPPRRLQEGTPGVVSLVAVVMGVVVIMGILAATFWQPPLDLRLISLSAVLFQISFAWTVLWAMALLLPLLYQEPFAWSCVAGGLLVKTGQSVGIVVLLLMKWRRVEPLLLVYTLALAALAAGMFQARDWFGVGPREGWRTMRRAGWVLGVTAALDWGALLAWAMRD